MCAAALLLFQRVVTQSGVRGRCGGGAVQKESDVSISCALIQRKSLLSHTAAAPTYTRAIEENMLIYSVSVI